MNGSTLPEDFWTRLDERFNKVAEKQDRLLEQIIAVNLHGCAHRKDDLQRIENLEAWKNKGIVGIISLSILALLQFFGLVPK